ncbi:MAG: bifunctional oligoribonuclease/PAP phosphatase NrnA [Acidimicrobiales bacterium]
MAEGVLEADLEAAIDRAAEVVAGPEALLLTCHTSPDGDALGSTLALHHLCRSQGRASQATWSEPYEVAPHYRFLPGLDLCTKPADAPREPAVVVTFDCGSLRRLGDLAGPAAWARDNGQLVVVDHHASNDRFGSLNVVDERAAATVVLVRRLAARLDWPLTRDVAMCLYTGLVTDTGRFTHATTTPAVFALAEELASFDLPIASMTRELFESHRLAYLHLAGEALSRARLVPSLSLVCAWVSRDDLARHGVGVDEVEGLIDLVRRTSEAEVACVAKEADDGVRVSLRSVTHQEDGRNWGVDVGAVATRLGGGGHRYAAGFTMAGPVPDVLAAVEGALAEHIGPQ